MGLDMYLYARKHNYKSSYREHIEYPKELKSLETSIMNKHGLCSIITNTDYLIGYWRKANAIHNWFVEKCGGGIDECQDIYVPIEKLEELHKLCEQVLENHDEGKRLLPTTSGFFFGSVEYDEWYFKDIEYTKNLIEIIIDFCKNLPQDDNDWEIVYRASW